MWKIGVYCIINLRNKSEKLILLRLFCKFIENIKKKKKLYKNQGGIRL